MTRLGVLKESEKLRVKQVDPRPAAVLVRQLGAAQARVVIMRQKASSLEQVQVTSELIMDLIVRDADMRTADRWEEWSPSLVLTPPAYRTAL